MYYFVNMLYIRLSNDTIIFIISSAIDLGYCYNSVVPAAL